MKQARLPHMYFLLNFGKQIGLAYIRKAFIQEGRGLTASQEAKYLMFRYTVFHLKMKIYTKTGDKGKQVFNR
jgi:hypothetical protein